MRDFGGREHGRYAYPYITLRMLLQNAYHLPAERVSGPAWMDSERYAIAASMPAETSDDQAKLMLQNLLKERFQLKLHFEEREMAVYALMVGKNGPRLNKTEDKLPEEAGLMKYSARDQNGAKHMEFTNASIEGLAKILSQRTDRPVIDMTGLSGAYDLKLDWSESPAPADQPKPADGIPVHPMEAMRASTDPSAILRSLASVGLRTEARKVPIKFLIVDHAEKLPTGN